MTRQKFHTQSAKSEGLNQVSLAAVPTLFLLFFVTQAFVVRVPVYALEWVEGMDGMVPGASKMSSGPTWQELFRQV